MVEGARIVAERRGSNLDRPRLKIDTDDLLQIGLAYTSRLAFDF